MQSIAAKAIRKNSVAQEAIKACLFESGVAGWEFKEGRYHRVMTMEDYPEIVQLISQFGAGVRTMLTSLNVTSQEYKFEASGRMSFEISIEQAAFDAEIRSRLGAHDGGELSTSVALFPPRSR